MSKSKKNYKNCAFTYLFGKEAEKVGQVMVVTHQNKNYVWGILNTPVPEKTDYFFRKTKFEMRMEDFEKMLENQEIEMVECLPVDIVESLL